MLKKKLLLLIFRHGKYFLLPSLFIIPGSSYIILNHISVQKRTNNEFSTRQTKGRTGNQSGAHD